MHATSAGVFLARKANSSPELSHCTPFPLHAFLGQRHGGGAFPARPWPPGQRLVGAAYQGDNLPWAAVSVCLVTRSDSSDHPLPKREDRGEGVHQFSSRSFSRSLAACLNSRASSRSLKCIFIDSSFSISASSALWIFSMFVRQISRQMA